LFIYKNQLIFTKKVKLLRLQDVFFYNYAYFYRLKKFKPFGMRLPELNETLKYRMKNSKKMKAIESGYLQLFSILIAMVFFATLSAYADEPNEESAEEKIENTFPFSDEMLLAFFDANREISSLQRETQETIEETLSRYNLTSERFGQIGRAAQIGALSSGTFTQEEIDAFNSAAPQVTSIQREQQSMMQALLMEKELSTQLYQEIMNMFRQDQNLQAYVRELARERAIEAVREERRQQRELEAQQGEPSE
jgi:hypothetical protein